jgi:hypothetical protein
MFWWGAPLWGGTRKKGNGNITRFCELVVNYKNMCVKLININYINSISQAGLG